MVKTTRVSPSLIQLAYLFAMEGELSSVCFELSQVFCAWENESTLDTIERC